MLTMLPVVLLVMQTFADSEMHAFEFKSLQDSLDEIKASVNPHNIRYISSLAAGLNLELTMSCDLEIHRRFAN